MGKKYCQWKPGTMGEWIAECGFNHCFHSSATGPGLNGFVYCPYCGGRLVKEYGPNGRTP